MNPLLRSTLRRLGLVRPAFRLYEQLLTIRLALTQPRPADADGLPLPPAGMLVLIGGDTNWEAYLEGGRVVAKTIRELLNTQGVEIGQLQAVLDFGCGCGRVMRYWKDYPGVDWQGSDYDAEMIAWCQRNLPFARFVRNESLPPTPFSDGALDLVYSYSVFTHFPEALQEVWLRELARLVRPGGYVLITTAGEHFLSSLTPAERRRFEAGELVTRYDEMSGANLCAAFHPEAYVHDRLAPAAGLRLALSVPGALAQDVHLLQKP